MARRIAREVSACAAILALTATLLAAQAVPAAADHFLTHGDALKAKPAPVPVPAMRLARADAAAATGGGTVQPRPIAIHDANVYLTPLAAGIDATLSDYSTDAAPQAKARGAALPGLLVIAAEAYSAQASKFPDKHRQAPQAYSLADAMRDAIWRKQTAQSLRELFGN